MAIILNLTPPPRGGSWLPADAWPNRPIVTDGRQRLAALRSRPWCAALRGALWGAVA